MDRRLCFVLLVLAISWCCSAKDLATADLKRESLDVSEKEVQATKLVSRNEQVCLLCEQYASEALAYLSNEQNQREITEFLLKTCYKLPVYKQECVGLVNQYATLFFLEISSLQPENLCQEIDLCEKVVSISQYVSNSSCDLCHRAVMEAIQQLKNPDTQVEVLQLLLKACDSAEIFSAKCKKLVFEYAPLILVNAEQFLETNDVCTLLHVCPSPTIGIDLALPRMEESRGLEAFSILRKKTSGDLVHML
ncbi:PREDICTED: prosaposin-like [Ipomoea nil]|uniref:prosaposin-like n=1 Tax=Ipomoea nil TaxID=35883 RepID=UPI0009018DCC|nr:PREDICTED: prosaposin-like [Ipomoea nil]